MSSDVSCMSLGLVETVSSDLLKQVTKRGADAAEVDVSIEDGFSVSARQGKLERVEQQSEQSLTLTVYQDQCSSSVSITDFSSSALNQAVDKVFSLVGFTQKDPFQGLADKSKLAFHYPELDLYHPWGISLDQAIDMAIGMDSAARSSYDKISHCDSCEVSTLNVMDFYANTLDFVGHYQYTRHMISCDVIAKDDSGKQQDSDYDIACQSHQLQDANQLAKTVAKHAVAKLSPKNITTKRYPIVFSAPLARSLFGCFISAINGHSIYRQSSFLLGCAGEMIFPEHITMQQCPHEKGVLSSSPFDDEGVKTAEWNILDAGRFDRYICDSYSARKIGCQTTGNAGGVFNVYVKSPTCSFKELLHKMGTGLYVTELMGQGVNLVTGDYSRGASGFWVENGDIQYPIDEFTIAGNLKEMFKNIIACADDIDLRGNIKTGSILIDGMLAAGS